MALNQSMLPEFDHEMASTRKLLERIPDDKMEWKPHPKSMTLGGLAAHLANLPQWTNSTLEGDSFDMSPREGEPPRMEPVGNAAEALQVFDRNVKSARESLSATDDDTMLSDWTLLAGGETVFTMPRVAVIRSFVMNHMIHHRAQLGVYLRLNEVPVPSVYGPTADDQGM